jgi:hypothetical protein
MLSIDVMKLIQEEILENLSLDIKRVTNTKISIQLKYKNEYIGEHYDVQTKLGYFEDHGHGGGSFVDSVKLIVEET